MLSTESVRVALEPILSKLCGPMGVTVMARMITGIIMSGVAAYAGAAREHTAVMRRVAAEIKRYCRICHWPMAKLDLLRSSLVHLLASQASKRIVAQIVDENNEVIKQIPPEEMLKIAARFREISGKLFDRKV